MTARTATARLYVSFAQVLTAVFQLICAAVWLVTALLGCLVEALQTRAAAPAPRSAALVVSEGSGRAARVEVSREKVDVSPGARATLLTSALTGMGFRRPDVDRFVVGLSPGALDTVPLAMLIKDGLRALTDN